MSGRSDLVHLFLCLAFLAAVLIRPTEDAGGHPVVDSGFNGTIKDIRTGSPLQNLTISFSAEFFDPVIVRTNASGGYEADLPIKSVYGFCIFDHGGASEQDRARS